MLNMEHEPINLIPEENKPQKTVQKPLRWRIFLAFSIIAFIAAAFWTVKIVFGNQHPNDPLQYDPNTLEPKKPEGIFHSITNWVFTDEYHLEGYNDDRINILMLGIGGPGHDGPFLTDTIILASIKPSSGQIALISIPRDMAADIPNHGVYKINHAAHYGQQDGRDGPDAARELISKMFQIEVPYVAQIDFQAFEEIIDYVGGVTVDVERSFVDAEYPAANKGFQTISFNSGIQTMDGATALKFVRSRHGSNGEGSDFARAKRQQKVIFALKAKLISASTLANPIRVNKIINSLSKHISTNMQFADLMYLIKLSRTLHTDQIITGVLDDSQNGFLQSTTGADGAYLLEPKTGNFNNINNYIQNIFTLGEQKQNNTPQQVADNAPIPEETTVSIEIQNGTWTPGLAAKLRKQLEERGLNINSVGNAEKRPQTGSAVYQVTSVEMLPTLQKLQNELKLPIKKELPDGIKPATTTDILILIGEENTE